VRLSARLKEMARSLKRELVFYKLVLRHEKTPRLAKVLLGAATFYLAVPIDLIPDFIPVIGHLDDVIIVPALVALAVKMIPRAVLDECRAAAGEGD
jgi:uncharacterized membrane protein YkvA (DUF1232 family)